MLWRCMLRWRWCLCPLLFCFCLLRPTSPVRTSTVRTSQVRTGLIHSRLSWASVPVIACPIGLFWLWPRTSHQHRPLPFVLLFSQSVFHVVATNI